MKPLSRCHAILLWSLAGYFAYGTENICNNICLQFSEDILCAKPFVHTRILSFNSHIILRKEAPALPLGVKSEVQ